MEIKILDIFNFHIIMKWIHVIAILLWHTVTVFAQTGTLHGRILDAETSKPLPFVNVYLNNRLVAMIKCQFM